MRADDPEGFQPTSPKSGPEVPVGTNLLKRVAGELKGRRSAAAPRPEGRLPPSPGSRDRREGGGAGRMGGSGGAGPPPPVQLQRGAALDHTWPHPPYRYFPGRPCQRRPHRHQPGLEEGT